MLLLMWNQAHYVSPKYLYNLFHLVLITWINHNNHILKFNREINLIGMFNVSSNNLLNCTTTMGLCNMGSLCALMGQMQVDSNVDFTKNI
jgi:hypothetical protein